MSTGHPRRDQLPSQFLNGITADVVGPTAYFFGTSVSLRANFDGVMHFLVLRPKCSDLRLSLLGVFGGLLEG